MPKSIRQFLEDGEGGAPTNNVSGGQVAGTGVDNPDIQGQGEPGGDTSIIKKKKKFSAIERRKPPQE